MKFSSDIRWSEKYFKGHLCNVRYRSGQRLQLSVNSADTYDLEPRICFGDTFGDYQALLKANVPFIFAEYGFGESSKTGCTHLQTNGSCQYLFINSLKQNRHGRFYLPCLVLNLCIYFDAFLLFQVYHKPTRIARIARI